MEVQILDGDHDPVEDRQVIGIRAVSHRGICGPRLLQGDLGGHRDEGTNRVVELLGARQIVLGQLHRRDLAGADGSSLLKGCQVV